MIGGYANEQGEGGRGRGQRMAGGVAIGRAGQVKSSSPVAAPTTERREGPWEWWVRILPPPI